MPKKGVAPLLLGLLCLVAVVSVTAVVARGEGDGASQAHSNDLAPTDAPDDAVVGTSPSIASSGQSEEVAVDVPDEASSVDAMEEEAGAALRDENSTTTRTHALHVEQLTPSADQSGKSVVLVSIADRTVLHVPASERHGKGRWRDAADSEDDFLVFDEDFDPLWYYVMKERDFTDVEWSGCGGKWRPEWSVPFHMDADARRADTGFPSASALDGAEGFALLKHFLSHHVVCSFSSVSFCSANKRESEVLHPRKEAAVNFANKNVHFQWAAQFISTLTSSPLSFTVDTPRHIRPNGVVLATSDPDGDAGAGNSTSSSVAEPWCSYHLVYHDTLCTQQISPLLQQGKYHKELKEESINGLPKKLIFNNVIASLFDFFSTPFHHFHFAVKRTTLADGGVDIEVITRMTFVMDDAKQTARLTQHWMGSLRRHEATEEQERLFARLSIFIGPGGLPKAMRAALPKRNIKQDFANPTAQQAAVAGRADSTWDSVDQPQVTYEVRSIGKDHGYYSVYLNPARALFQGRHQLDRFAQVAGEEGAAPLRAGDEVRTLMMFPLHLLRPRFYNFESFLGGSVLENFSLDKESNTLVVMVRTPITEAHVQAFNATFSDTPPAKRTGKANPHEQNHEHPMLLLARFQFLFGWGALKDVPRDANRFSIVPQPIVKLERRLPTPPSGAVTATTAQCAALCDDIGFASEALTGASSNPAHAPFLDHEKSLLKMMRALSTGSTAPPDQCSCYHMLRSAVSAGAFLPTPDAAMVFNVLALGLTFASLAMSFFFRSFRKLNCRSKDLLFVETGAIAEEAEGRPS